MFNFEINNWFRVMARFCDYAIFFLVLGTISLFLPFFYAPFFYYFLALAIPLLWVPVEAFLISKWGRTPGKFLFGFTVRTLIGLKLSYFEAFKWSLFLPGRPGTLRQKHVSWKRRWVGFVSSSAFVLAALYGNALTLWSTGLNQGISQEGWVQYSSDDARFKVSFPKDPEEASKELVIPDSGKVINYEEVTSHHNKKVHYSVAHLKLPGKWKLAASATVLKGVFDGLVVHTENVEVLQKDFSKFGRYRVLDYRLQQGDELMRGRLIIVSGILYKLTVTYPKSFAGELENDPFLDSFEVS